MTYTIKASEVKLGMEIEWSRGGVLHRLTPNNIATFKWNDNFFIPDSYKVSGYNFCAEGGGVQWVSADQEVTVLSEPTPAQPDEPTAFGAAVEAGGVWFVRVDDRSFEDPDFRPWQSASLIECTWAEVCEQGPVTVVIRDPFATPEAHDATEPRTWDRWEDVPDMVVVRTEVGLVVVRRNGDRIERLFSDNEWDSSILTADDLNTITPFTEVLDA